VDTRGRAAAARVSADHGGSDSGFRSYLRPPGPGLARARLTDRSHGCMVAMSRCDRLGGMRTMARRGIARRRCLHSHLDHRTCQLTSRRQSEHQHSTCPAWTRGNKPTSSRISRHAASLMTVGMVASVFMVRSIRHGSAGRISRHRRTRGAPKPGLLGQPAHTSTICRPASWPSRI
jgi:hypothetical protein